MSEFRTAIFNKHLRSSLKLGVQILEQPTSLKGEQSLLVKVGGHHIIIFIDDHMVLRTILHDSEGRMHDIAMSAYPINTEPE